MKTPMQELIETFEEMKDPNVESSIDVDFAISLAKSMLEKEKEVMVDFAYNCRNLMAADEFAITHWYDKTFNTKEK